MTRFIGIKVSIMPETQEQAARVIETLSNVLTGFAMDDIPGDITITPFDHDEGEA